MEKVINKLKDHYIVCGIDGVGYHIVNDAWMYNPSDDYVLQSGDSLLVMSTPEERIKFDKAFAAG